MIVKIGLIKEIGKADVKAHPDLFDGVELHVLCGFAHKII